MPKDQFQPILNETSARTYIRPGVVDDSKAVALQGVPNMIRMADKGYEQYALTKAIERDINPIIETYEGGVKGLAESDATLAARDTIFKQAQGVPTEAMVGLIDANAASLQKSLDKVSAAEKQGLMSPARAMAAITKATREAISKNPWLEAQMYERVQEHLKRTGVADTWKERESVAQGNQSRTDDEMKYARAEYDEREMPFDPYAGPEVWRRDINADSENKALLKASDQEALRAEKRTIAEVKGAVTGGSASKLWNAELGRFNKVATALSQAPFGSTEHSANIAKIRQEASSLKNKLSQMLVNGMPDPTVKAFAEGSYKHLDETLEIYEKNFSNADRTKALENRASMMNSQQRIETMGIVNAGTLEVVQNFAKALDPVNGLGKYYRMQTEEERKKLDTAIYTMAQGGLDNTAVQNLLQTPVPIQIISSLMGGVQGEQNPFERQRKTDSTLEYISSMTAALTTPEAFKTPKDQAGSALRFLSEVATNKDMKEILSGNSGYGQSIGKVVDTHMNGVIDIFAAVVFKHSAENPNIKFTYDVLPNGAFEVISNDPAVSKEMNTKLSTQVNTSLDAYANSLGITRERAAPAFYKQYFAELTEKDKDLIALGKGISMEQPRTGDEPLKGVVKDRAPKRETTPEIPMDIRNLPDVPPREGPVPLKTEKDVRRAFESGDISADEFGVFMARIRAQKTPTKTERRKGIAAPWGGEATASPGFLQPGKERRKATPSGASGEY